MKNNFKKMLPSILLLAVAVSALTMTFAWYITNVDLQLSTSSNVVIEVGNNIEISKLLPKEEEEDADTWSDYGSQLLYNADTRICDVTGDGINFQSPTSISKTTGEPKAPMYIVQNNAHDGYYRDFNLKVRCNFSCSLYLSEGSYVKPASSVDAETEAVATGVSQLFPADYIAGAVRVALLEDTVDSNGVKTGERLVQIWIPNDKYETTFLTDSNGRRPNGFFLNGFREETYGYQTNNEDNDAIVTHTYVDTDYLTNKVVVGNHGVLANADTQLANHSLPIISFLNDGVAQEKRFTLRVWIEGSDREANDVTNMGKIDYYFKFVTLSQADSDATADAALQSISCQSETVEDETVYKLFNGATPLVAADKIEYSFDGIDWTLYTDKLSFPVRKERRTNSDGSYRLAEDGSILLNETVIEKSIVYIKNVEEINQRHSHYEAVTVPLPVEE